jgi:quercetin dioxygenase-like cupin family protein
MTATAIDNETIEWLGVPYRTTLKSRDTGRAMSIVESVSPPRSGPPRHIHHHEDETFVLLTGACDFWVDGSLCNRQAGETIFVRRGTPHTFRVSGDAPSRHLTILTPGGFEGFFAEMAKGRFRIPEDMAAINEAAERHHLSFAGPPLGAE